MHARLLDMLHDAANQHAFAVADGVDVHFHRVVQKRSSNTGASLDTLTAVWK